MQALRIHEESHLPPVGKGTYTSGIWRENLSSSHIHLKPFLDGFSRPESFSEEPLDAARGWSKPCWVVASSKLVFPVFGMSPGIFISHKLLGKDQIQG